MILDEEAVMNIIPIAHFKSNQLNKKEYYMSMDKKAIDQLDKNSEP